jgi:hypothetical protein
MANLPEGKCLTLLFTRPKRPKCPSSVLSRGTLGTLAPPLKKEKLFSLTDHQLISSPS